MIPDTSTKFNTHQMVFSNGENVGHVQGDIYHRYALRIHQLRKPPAWAYRLDSLEKAKRFGASRLMIHVEGLYTITASMADMDTYGRDFNRGYGSQRMLGMKYWHRVEEEKPADDGHVWWGIQPVDGEPVPVNKEPLPIPVVDESVAAPVQSAPTQSPREPNSRQMSLWEVA